MDVPTAVTATGLVLGAAGAVAWVGIAAVLVLRSRLTGLVSYVAARLPARFSLLLLSVWEHLLTALEPLRSIGVVTQVVGVPGPRGGHSGGADSCPPRGPGALAAGPEAGVSR